ncbi:MAG: 3-phosphoshikimate 1-carboxyvinyltransferase [Crocinitomicaceae bacterium]|nr:3-phosphoshikimate 1-carboxyvinyltransferase [Crocinitomicaceae bacterium]
MNITVWPSLLSGTVHAPASKSVMQRLVAGALLSHGTSVLHNLSQADDCTASLLMAAQLGAEVAIGENHVAITGVNGQPKSREGILTPMESGLGSRLFAPIAGLAPPPIQMSAEGNLKGRPMHEIIDAVKALGGKIEGKNGSFPLAFNASISGGKVNIDGSLSSQFLTGLLMALPCAPNDSHIVVRNLVSKPYVVLTLEILEDFGIEIDSNQQLTEFSIRGGQNYEQIEAAIDGDWSSAAALAVAGMLCAEQSLEIDGLNSQYTQADEAIRGALLFAGGALSGTETGIQVAKRPVRAFSVDLTDSPDLFPVLCALASFGKKPSKLKGVHRLTHKESDRAQVLQEEWAKFNVVVELDKSSDTMTVHPCKGACDKAITIDPHGDHRIAMAAALMGLRGKDPVIIQGAECVAKSYPEFFDDLEVLGAKLSMKRN